MKLDFHDQLNKLITYWRKEGIKLNSGISIDEIKKFEAAIGFTFEEDFHTYLNTTNGFEDFDWDQGLFSFWSIDRIKSENEDHSHPPDLVWFSDHSINVCSFGFHKNDRKIYTHYQHVPGIEIVADSFSEFVGLYLQDYALLLR